MNPEENEERLPRQHYFAVYYNTELDDWYAEGWEEATGRDDGTIWDEEEDDFRFPDDSIIPDEEELDRNLFKALNSALCSMPKMAKPKQKEEPDLLY